MPKKLVIKELSEGSGPAATKGDKMTVEFVGVDEAGKVVYSSWSKEGPPNFDFKLGAGKVFAGWDKGLAGMKVGERREVFFPASVTEKLGPLIYVIDLVKLE